MNSRMEKYYQDDLSDMQRSKKNQQLYHQVYEKEDNLENLDIPSNTNEIDLTNLKLMVNSRDDYRKIREYEQISNKHLVPEEQVEETPEVKQKIYDINELLSQAKSSNINNNRPKSNYLEALKLEHEMIQKNKEIDTYIPPKEEEQVSTKSLPLDILTDLKPDDDTVISSPVTHEEVVAKETVTKINDNVKEETDTIFYSGSYKFSKSDFDDGEGKASRGVKTFFKFILILIFVIALNIGIFYFIINYLM